MPVQKKEETSTIYYCPHKERCVSQRDDDHSQHLSLHRRTRTHTGVFVSRRSCPLCKTRSDTHRHMPLQSDFRSFCGSERSGYTQNSSQIWFLRVEVSAGRSQVQSVKILIFLSVEFFCLLSGCCVSCCSSGDPQ